MSDWVAPTGKALKMEKLRILPFLKVRTHGNKIRVQRGGKKVRITSKPLRSA